MQLEYHKNFIKNNGVTEESVLNSINVFKKKLSKIDKNLAENKFIISKHITIVDVAVCLFEKT